MTAIQERKASPALRRVQIRDILQRHNGSIKSIANDLGITSQAVSLWLAGRSTSKRVAEASERKALALLEEERKAGVA